MIITDYSQIIEILSALLWENNNNNNKGSFCIILLKNIKWSPKKIKKYNICWSFHTFHVKLEYFIQQNEKYEPAGAGCGPQTRRLAI